MKLTSPVFQNNGKIPEKYTCDSDNNISPPLEISDVPKTAKCLVLIMDDPDIPEFVKKKFKTEVWDHWIVFNIPPNTKKIEECKNPIGLLGINTNKDLGYTGPCLPDKEHRYFFRLYALNIILNLKEGSTKLQVEQAMQNNILAETFLIGKYERKK